MLKGGVNKDGRKTSKDFCRRVCLACEFTRLEEILLRSTTMIIFSGNATMCEFFFLIQPFSSFGLAAKNRGLISFLGSRTIRTIQFKFKYRSVFFFLSSIQPRAKSIRIRKSRHFPPRHYLPRGTSCAREWPNTVSVFLDHSHNIARPIDFSRYVNGKPRVGIKFYFSRRRKSISNFRSKF